MTWTSRIVLLVVAGALVAGAALLEIGDPQALELVVDVLSEDAVAMRPGMAARVVHWGESTALAARLARVEPAAFTRTSALGVDEHRVHVVLDLDGSPAAWRGLGDGFAIEVEIVVWSRPGVVQAPISALFRRGSGWAVFQVVDGRAAEREVQVGHRGAMDSEILGGLEPGDLVIAHPSASLRGGVRVAYR